MPVYVIGGSTSRPVMRGKSIVADRPQHRLNSLAVLHLVAGSTVLDCLDCIRYRMHGHPPLVTLDRSRTNRCQCFCNGLVGEIGGIGTSSHVATHTRLGAEFKIKCISAQIFTEFSRKSANIDY